MKERRKNKNNNKKMFILATIQSGIFLYIFIFFHDRFFSQNVVKKKAEGK